MISANDRRAVISANFFHKIFKLLIRVTLTCAEKAYNQNRQLHYRSFNRVVRKTMWRNNHPLLPHSFFTLGCNNDKDIPLHVRGYSGCVYLMLECELSLEDAWCRLRLIPPKVSLEPSEEIEYPAFVLKLYSEVVSLYSG
mmetsp:Transcript_3177/g.4625  ORF Transcript_3177/g.4625 Transcript_3177/m.4625 type:complete len:140 (-) Transcript_3177:198-617(-)